MKLMIFHLQQITTRVFNFLLVSHTAAWRAVWEEWKIVEPETAPSAPCMMDFLLYRIEREYCDDKLVEFVCENGRRFFHFGARLKLCRQCRSTLTPVRRLIPCQTQAEQLPRDEDGRCFGFSTAFAFLNLRVV